MTAGLFDPITLGALPLQHRVVLAPMTRLRADPDDSPSAMMGDYYRQRASPGGLLITESLHPPADSRGYLGAPGLYTERHVQRWTPIVDAVHDAGATIIVQIAHDGRQSHSDLTDGRPPIAPSLVPFETQVVTQDGWVPNSAHRALDTDQIPALVKTFGEAARRALAIGFDGIELHAANGYLVDTFLQDGTNKRTDRYGGSIAARARFPLEVTAALIDVFGA
jgi:N-ethylmaleimide reductase